MREKLKLKVTTPFQSRISLDSNQGHVLPAVNLMDLESNKYSSVESKVLNEDEFKIKKGEVASRESFISTEMMMSESVLNSISFMNPNFPLYSINNNPADEAADGEENTQSEDFNEESEINIQEIRKEPTVQASRQ